MPTCHIIAATAAIWMIGVPALAPATPGAHPTPGHSTAARPAAPQLDIAVTDGRTSAAAGDRLSYTITIHNLGTAAVRGLRVSENLPVGLTFVSTDHGGVTHAGRITWAINLNPGTQAVLASVGRVEQTPRDLLRLAVVACAASRGDDRPLVCATHSDLLPAGAAAITTVKPSSSSGIWFAIGTAALIAIALIAIGWIAFIVMRRRHRRRTPPVPSRVTGHSRAGASTRG